MSDYYQNKFMILKMWYWNWDEDDSISKVVLLNNDKNLDACVRECVTKFALTHNISRPKEKVVDIKKLTDMMIQDIRELTLSLQTPDFNVDNHTMMNVLSYTDTKPDGHIEVMGMFTSPYEIFG